MELIEKASDGVTFIACLVLANQTKSGANIDFRFYNSIVDNFNTITYVGYEEL